MTSSTTAAKGSRLTRRLWAISATAHVVGFVLLQHFGILDYTMAFSRGDAEERVREARERNARLKEHRQEERDTHELTEDVAEHMRRRAEEERAKELREHVRQLREIDRLMGQQKESKLDEIEQRPEISYRRHLAERLFAEASDLMQRTRGLLYRHRTPDTQALAGQAVHLLQRAASLKREPESRAKAKTVRGHADTTALTSREVAAVVAPGGTGDAWAASEVADEVQRLARLLDNDSLDLAEFNDTRIAQHPPREALSAERLAQLEQMSPDELYELARALEGRIGENFTDFRGGQLAITDNTTLAEALQNLADMGMPLRPEFPELGATQFPTLGDLDAFRRALQGATGEAADMRARAMNQLGQCGFSFFPGMGGGAGTNPFAVGLASNTGRLPLDMNLDLTALRDFGLEGGADGKAWDDQFFRGGAGMDAFPVLPEMAMNRYTVQAQAMPGRKFKKDSPRTGWLYIDTWYTIGPWANEGVIDWTVAHPPEHDLNLDAEYRDGKKGVYDDHLLGGRIELDGVLRWQFLQSDTVRITFPKEISDGTYYAYTEVFFEEDEDMLLAIASDDAARVWVNGLALHEEHELSSWEIGEKYKKIPFRQGINTILVRLENGPTYAQLSVLLCPPEVLTP